MGSEFAIAALGLTQVATEVAGGFASRSAANSAARQKEAEAKVIAAETQRDLAQKKREILAFRDSQAQKFNNAGVLLEGSPLVVLEETLTQGQEELSAIANQGRARANLSISEAGSLRRQGRNALIGGFSGAASGAFNTLLQGQRFGLFGKTSPNKTPASPQRSFLDPVVTINPYMSK